MKILHYHKDIRLETGGVVRAVLDTCSGLAATEHEVVLMSPNPQDVPDAWRAGAAGAPRIVPVAAPRRPGDCFSRGQIRDLEPELQSADVLHLHGMWGTFNAQLARAARRLGVPYVYSVHGMLDDWCMAQRTLKKRAYLALMGTRCLHEAFAVHCTAQAELDQSRRWFPRGNGVVVPLILDTTSFERLPGPGPARARFPELEDGRPSILFLSRIHYKKGIEHLLRAARRLRDDGCDALVWVVGTGDEPYVRSLRALAQELGIEEQVRFPGFVSGVEKISMYEAADVFVLPTSQENFGFVLFEALAAGTPVVTTRGADTWPEMEASGGAVVVGAEAGAIADAVRGLLDDPERRARMGAAGRSWVLENLSADAVVQRYVDLYASAAS